MTGVQTCALPICGGAGWDGSDADCSAGGARVGVSLPGVLSTRVFVLFRLIGVEGRLGEPGTYSTAFTLPLLAIFSASTRSLSLL